MLLEIASICLYEAIKISFIVKLVQRKHDYQSTQQAQIVFDISDETTTPLMTTQAIRNTNMEESHLR
jgi:hypothetical protein